MEAIIYFLSCALECTPCAREAFEKIEFRSLYSRGHLIKVLWFLVLTVNNQFIN